MRPLLHPAVEEITVEAVLDALGDPIRFTILADIVRQDCSANCSAAQAVLAKPIPKSTLSQHIRVLREAGLIRSERRGVEVLNSSRCAEVNERFPGLLDAITRAYAAQSGAERKQRKPKKQTPRRSGVAAR